MYSTIAILLSVNPSKCRPATPDVQTPTEIVVLPKDEIDTRVASKQSMMPDGVLEQLSPTEVRALVAYLGRATPLEKK